MTKFVSFKVKIPLASKAVGQEANHLVESHSTVNDRGEWGQIGHVCVELCIAKMHHYGLVANQPRSVIRNVSLRGVLSSHLRLVVALAVGNRLLTVPSVCERPANATNIPVFVLGLFEDLDPHIRNGHGQPVIEADTTEREGETQSRHAGHILGDGDDLGVQPMKHLVSQHQIHNAFLIDLGAKVLVISSGEAPVGLLVTCTPSIAWEEKYVHSDNLRSDTVMCIEHACYTIEAESVELIFIHPETQVAEKEAEHFMVPVVKKPTVPQLMAALASLMEVLVIRAIKLVQAIEDILGSMAMDHVKKNNKS